MTSQTFHRRSSSGSTVRPAGLQSDEHGTPLPATASIKPVQATLWVHDDSFSTEQILLNESILTDSGIQEGSLVEVSACPSDVERRDFDPLANERPTHSNSNGNVSSKSNQRSLRSWLCIAKLAPPEFIAKQQGLEVSVTRNIATAFGFTSRSQVMLKTTEFKAWTASHVEISFRDAYLARSDMWRFASQELVGKTIYAGQKITFMGSMKATVKNIHLRGRHARTAYFSGATIPVFRSEAARFVIFVQMSQEMWDFDSDGSGEIMFNRVVNGFLPDLFKRWSELEVRHLVSIVMFGRVEYNRSEMDQDRAGGTTSRSSFSSDLLSRRFQDFYRVVVTDMASAQWNTILDELKKDFRVFLRDLSLFSAPTPHPEDILLEDPKPVPTRITGRLSTALKGNILEAINLAASQFSNDYVDRDLIRTGVSTVVVTAGTGVFDVDRDLLTLTSENLTNNGIGIDVVCLSKMPLHSVPLFRYRLSESTPAVNGESGTVSHNSPSGLSSSFSHPSLPNLSQSPAFSSMTSASANYFARFPAAFPSKVAQFFGYGIPQWIDLSYWSPDAANFDEKTSDVSRSRNIRREYRHSNFVPRVRMYELQMMGLMEMGMADIAIPYLAEVDNITYSPHKATVPRPFSTRSDRSLSQSPEIVRRTPFSRIRSPAEKPLSSIQRPTTSKIMEEMDRYDELLFQYQRSKPKKRSPRKAQRKRSRPKNSQDPLPSPSLQRSTQKDEQERSRPSTPAKTLDGGSDTASVLSLSKKPQKPARISRNISYALRGLAPLKPTAATAEVKVENVNAQLQTKNSVIAGADLKPSASGSILETKDAPRHHKDHSGDGLSSIAKASSEEERPTKPISITNTTKGLESMASPAMQTRHQLNNQNKQIRAEIKNREEQSSEEDSESSSASIGHVSGSMPRTRIPFVRNVNASNPLKHKFGSNSFGRWQHLYPHKPRASTVKWRSLCTPASVPLTTDEFPSREALSTEYDSTTHHVNVLRKDDVREIPEKPLNSLLLEMISLRLAHGYQFVVGYNVAKAAGKGICDCSALFSPADLSEKGNAVFMSMGNTIQRLSFADEDQIDVTRFVKKVPFIDQTVNASQDYGPYIRTILSRDYMLRRVVLEGFSEEYPWDLADSYLAAENNGKFEEPKEQLRCWRARFVLIPVEPPATTWKMHQAEENEEEIHLLGIRALTQMWQRNRYIPPEERKTAQNRMSSFKRHAQNPLEVKMETLNPSELVATELDRMLQLEDGGEDHSTQLLPEPDKLDRESAMQKFSQAMQSDRGIEIKNRRWHLRLYYNCFHGEEFTNWLMHNVKGMDARQDAVELGNELMKEGLFEHVNGRHNFKDGNYFYSIKPDFRTPRLDLRTSWFPSSRQSNRSIPATPSTDQPSRDSVPLTVRTRSGSNLAHQLNSASSTESPRLLTDKKRKVVSLSRMIRLDVDTRKRSFFGRQELVNLHYDRLHNPENCYHIELNWLSTTCKLVDDAISTWSNTAEKYGLKLVEVPIAEACDVPLSEPFRNPYRIKLCVDPPKRSNTATSTTSQNPTSAASTVSFNNVFFTATAFGPQQAQNVNVDKHVYQKALLKKFNFVLDLEAANEFPENVDIQYSWGKLKYKYTQFVHRSGVILAQITDNGDLLLLGNRLYNSRLATTTMKDGTNKFDTKRDVGPQSHRPPVPPIAPVNNNYLSAGGGGGASTNMQASGIVGLNVASPSAGLTAISHSGSTPSPSPRVRPFGATPSILSPGTPAHAPVTHHALPFSPQMPFTPGFSAGGVVADSFGTRSALISSGFYNTFVTPEQIKDEVEAFCSNRQQLESFYREVHHLLSQPPAPTGSRKAGSTSSSLLRPVREVPGGDEGGLGGIPAFELPESITAAASMSPINAIAARRATVAYENINEMMGKEIGVGVGAAGVAGGSGSRQGSGGTIGSVGDAEMALAAVARSRHGSAGAAGKDSPMRKATK